MIRSVGYAVEVQEFERRDLFYSVGQKYGENALAVLGQLMGILLPGAQAPLFFISVALPPDEPY